MERHRGNALFVAVIVRIAIEDVRYAVLALMVADVLTINPVLVVRLRARTFAHPRVQRIEQLAGLTLIVAVILVLFVKLRPIGTVSVTVIVSRHSVRHALRTPTHADI